MSVKKVALLFPGQGAWYPGVLKHAVDSFPQIGSVFADIDAVAERRLAQNVTDVIWSERRRSVEELLVESPEVLQLAIFGASVAVYRLLESEGLRPDVLVGHSFGEIAALSCGGAFTVAEGAEIVCDRTEAARLVASDGYMAALGADASKAATLVDLLGNHDMVIAGENGDAQTILSGQRVKMDRAGDIARILNLAFFRLNSPYPFHSPLMEPVRAEFKRRLQRVSPSPLTIPVFSPIVGRYYETNDRLTESLADHLVRPVRFAQAVGQLHTDGIRIIVECGPLDALTKLSKKAAPSADLTAIACLTGEGDEVGSLKRAMSALAVLGKTRAAETARLAMPFVPELAGADSAFWNDRGAAIRQFVEQEYERFRERQTRHDTQEAAVQTTSIEAPAVAASNDSARAPMSRVEVFRDLVSMYASALEYPEEVFTDTVELEAELGIDSVKQTELLARVSEKYGLPPRPADFKLSQYNTIGKVADFVVSAARPAADADVRSQPEPTAPLAQRAPANAIRRDELFKNLVSMYAEALEYPEEVFTRDVELEAELGIDSVKQTELLARLGEQYGLPPRPSDFRLADYNTLGKVADFVFSAMTAGRSASFAPAPSGLSSVEMSHATASAAESGLAVQ